MDQLDKNNIMVCSKCRHVFHISEAIDTETEVYNIKIKEKGCPECGGKFHMLELPVAYEKYLFCNFDERYFTYPDKMRN